MFIFINTTYSTSVDQMKMSYSTDLWVQRNVTLLNSNNNVLDYYPADNYSMLLFHDALILCWYQLTFWPWKTRFTKDRYLSNHVEQEDYSSTCYFFIICFDIMVVSIDLLTLIKSFHKRSLSFKSSSKKPF